MQNKFFRFLLFFLVFLLLLQMLQGKKNQAVSSTDDIVLRSSKEWTVGKEVTIEILNQTETALTLPSNCPVNPLRVERYDNGKWAPQNTALQDESQCAGLPDLIIAPNDSEILGFGKWNPLLFREVGLYRISLDTVLNEENKTYYTEIEVVPLSLIKRAWNALLFKPIYNTLFLLASKLPGHGLGWSIILLTILIKLLLLGPNQKALKSQKALQQVQPQLDALKLKYKDDPQRLAQETMEIWKKYKVSPMGSCLPMLIQFPVLIALFYVVKGGLGTVDPDLLYASLKNFDTSLVNPHFLGLNLTQANTLVLPVIIGLLQFMQIRLSLTKNKSSAKDASNPALPMMNNMMQYFMPVMIAVFTASLPAAVGFYWGVSTLFGIGQQLVVNYSRN